MPRGEERTLSCIVAGDSAIGGGPAILKSRRVEAHSDLNLQQANKISFPLGNRLRFRCGLELRVRDVAAQIASDTQPQVEGC